MKKTVSEAIIVEGRDDTAAVSRAVSCVTIETHGFGMPDEIWPVIERAYNSTGIIVFTDPDYAGEKIRRKVTERFPACKQAFLPKDKALKRGNIGVENASPEDIVCALDKARCTDRRAEPLFTEQDLARHNLTGTEAAKDRRQRLGEMLSVGYGNGRTFLKKLNSLGVSREEFEEKAKEL